MTDHRPKPPQPSAALPGSASPSAWLAAGTGVLAAAVSAATWRSPAAASFGYLAGAGVWLAVIDVRRRRLPDRILLPAVMICTALLAWQAVLDHAPARLGRALLGLLVSFACFLVLGMVSAGIGGGDVKLAGLLGLMLAWAGSLVLAAGLLGAFLLALPLAGLLLVRGAGRATQIPFGPFMLASAALALVGSMLG